MRTFKVEFNIEELFSILSSAFKTYNSRILRKFIDEWYKEMTEEERLYFYERTLKELYYGHFVSNPSFCKLDAMFMGRFNPNQQIVATVKTDISGVTKDVECFRVDGQCYVSSYESIPKELIVKTEYW